MDKKSVLIGSVFVALGINIIPIFVKQLASIDLFMKILAGLVFGVGVVYFVAGDAIKNKKDPYQIKLKEINQQVKEGKMNPTEAFKFEKEMLEEQYRIEKERYELSKKRKEIEELKMKSKPKGINYEAILGSDKNGKSLDVLGNISGIVQSDNKQTQTNKKSKKDNLDSLNELF